VLVRVRPPAAVLLRARPVVVLARDVPGAREEVARERVVPREAVVRVRVMPVVPVERPLPAAVRVRVDWCASPCQR
jgi:hypothetical protein